MDTSYFSKKITFLNVFLTFCIVTMHSIPLYRCGFTLDWDYPLMYAIYIFTQIAVPLFFFISGLLFYKTCNTYAKTWEKIKSRVRSLLVPYLLWNTIFVLIYFSLSHLSMTHSVVSMGSELDSLEKIIKSILNSNYTVLWFVKNLMIYTALSPLLYWLVSKPITAALLLVGFVSAVFLCDLSYESPISWFPVYWVGCIYGHYYEKVDSLIFNKVKDHLGITFLLVLLFFITYFLSMWNEKSYLTIFRMVSPLLIYCAVDGLLYNYLNINFEKKKWMSSMFFIYCCHNFLLTMLQKSSVLFLPKTDLTINILFVVSPVIVIGFLLLLSDKFGKYKVYKILSGGR